MAQGDVLRTSEVSTVKNGIKYTLEYEVIDLGKGREGVKFPDHQLILKGLPCIGGNDQVRGSG